MPWRNETNKIDSGVYGMLHMETYMGQKMRDWNCGLKQRSEKHMRFLRVKYCKALLTSENNNHSADNV